MPSLEAWAGAIGTENVWFAYTGSTSAPFGGLDQPGFRLRAQAGHGEYKFEGWKVSRDAAGTFLVDRIKIEDRVNTADAMVGYLLQLGALTAKGFAGLAYVEHDVTSTSVTASADGVEWGPRLQLELWYDAGGPYWASLNATYTTAHDTYGANLRGGFRLGQTGISIGTEISIDSRTAEVTDLTAAYARGGAFVRYAWETGEFSVSGGLAVDLDDGNPLELQPSASGLYAERLEAPYAGINLLTKF
ncbi:MAG: cellulose biosynthesis protein BcsS [Hyphomicrobiaceae bacterium]|nr:cellulose biosynthesis protein BcsS [Hyphomicrobiaceae bacterium]